MAAPHQLKALAQSDYQHKLTVLGALQRDSLFSTMTPVSRLRLPSRKNPSCLSQSRDPLIRNAIMALHAHVLPLDNIDHLAMLDRQLRQI